MNYEELGFKCGIEIHQQLEGHKLFCNCPSVIKKDNPDFTFKRRLRVSASETGDRDKAAEFEEKKQKEFLYQGYHDATCLVEMDEEPPAPVNKDAVRTAVIVAKLLNMKIVDQVEVMRKVVIDGSNVSGFQRTMLIGYDGFVEVNGRKIGVESLCLEEESAQAIERTSELDTYNLSRLGIPLLEIATAPDISSAEECKEVAAKLGMILRSTGACRRGIGSIRQDVNVSIKDGYRVEIKGFQELKQIPAIIDVEVQRQIDEVEKKGPHVRNADVNEMKTTYLRPMPGAARMYPETDIPSFVLDLDVALPELLDDKIKGLAERHSISEDLARQLVKKNINFNELMSKFPNLKPVLVAEYVLNLGNVMSKKYEHVHTTDYTDFIMIILEKLNNNEISVSAVEEIMAKHIKGEQINFEDYKPMDDSAMEEAIKKIISENQGAPMGALMGKCMAHFQGKADGKKVNEILRKYINN